MTIEVVAPKTSLTAQEVTLLEWKKKEGDLVQKDEVVAVIETEKTSLDITSPATGRMSSIGVGQGATVAIGSILCTIEGSG